MPTITIDLTEDEVTVTGHMNVNGPRTDPRDYECALYAESNGHEFGFAVRTMDYGPVLYAVTRDGDEDIVAQFASEDMAVLFREAFDQVVASLREIATEGSKTK